MHIIPSTWTDADGAAIDLWPVDLDAPIDLWPAAGLSDPCGTISRTTTPERIGR